MTPNVQTVRVWCRADKLHVATSTRMAELCLFSQHRGIWSRAMGLNHELTGYEPAVRPLHSPAIVWCCFIKQCYRLTAGNSPSLMILYYTVSFYKFLMFNNKFSVFFPEVIRELRRLLMQQAFRCHKILRPFGLRLAYSCYRRRHQRELGR